MKSSSDSYKEAGVDITAGYRAVELIKSHVARTSAKELEVSGIGGFGGLFPLDVEGMDKPVLVSGTDGVGTKLKLAFIMDKHDTVGQDCVAMCVNDIICLGAKPLFFLDYIALGKNIPEKVEQIVKGVADGCVMSGASLIGGETAEMPGFYPEDEYDLAGFALGIVDEKKIIKKSHVKAGDLIIGLPSSGIHSNGYSLIRKVFDVENRDITEPLEGLGGKSLGEVLLEPTKIYVKPVLNLIDKVRVHGLAHITGGGFYENIPRAFEEGLEAVIYEERLPKQAIFSILEEEGKISHREMYNTFNMGIGMIVIVSPKDAEYAIDTLKEAGENPVIIGEMRAGACGVVIL